jgi:hypothetical protein
LEVSGQLHAPAALPPGKRPRYPFYRRLGGPQSRSGRYGEVKIFYPTGLELPLPLVVQPVASRYTDWAIPAHWTGRKYISIFVIRQYEKQNNLGQWFYESEESLWMGEQIQWRADEIFEIFWAIVAITYVQVKEQTD